MITRDNYQEFFLLYIDNELSMADRKNVEQWVAANPDLQEEWESLLTCRVSPADEHIVFRDKHLLLRAEEDSYEELQKDQRLRLHPDLSIVFPDKSTLYKKEKDRRVIIFYRLSAGIAAALLIAVSLLLFRSRPVAPAVTTAPALVKNTPAPDKKDSFPVTPATAVTLYSAEDRDRISRQPDKIARTKIIPSPAIAEEKRPAMSNEKTEPSKQEPQYTAMAIAKPEHDPVNEVKAVSLPLATQQVNIPKEQSSFATQALLQEDNEKDIATATEPASPNKNKLRGIFRKVARTFGKTADRDGEGKREVLINAFQVALD